MTQRLHGPGLVGFGDYFSGYDDLGASKPKADPKDADNQPTIKYPPAKKSATIANHGKVMTKANSTAHTAAQTIGKIQLQLGKKPAAVTLPSGRSTAPRGAVVSKTIHVGAAAAAAMSPRAQAAVAKHNASAVKDAAARKKLAQHALHLKATVADLAKKMVAQKKALVALRTPHKGAHVGHLINQIGALLEDPEVGDEVAEIVGDFLDTVGADAAGLSPGQPGYDPTSDTTAPGYDPTQDPNSPQFSGAAATDPSLTPDPLDSSSATFPTYDISTPVPDMVSAGGIQYTGQKGTPQGYVVSYGLATRKTDHKTGFSKAAGIDVHDHYGYVWGQYADNTPSKGVPFGDFKNKSGWNHIYGGNRDGGGNWHKPVDASEAYGSFASTSPHGKEYGPLVGNPAMPDFVNMRVDAAGNMFWLPQEAPDWLTAPIKQAAAVTAQAAATAQAATDAANAAALAQQQTAENLAADAAQAQAALADTAQTTQQNQAEADAQTATVAQAQADTAAQVQQQAQDKQTNDLLVQQAQQQLAYDQAHPDQAYGPDAQAADDGSDDGSTDDGSQDDGSGDDGSGDDPYAGDNLPDDGADDVGYDPRMLDYQYE